MKKDNIVIVGGSGGIGKNIIKLLIESDYRVINVDRSSLNIKNENYREIITNITTNNVDQIIDQIMKEEHSIYAFISAIGYYGVETLKNYNRDSYTMTMSTNVEIPTLFSVSFAKIMQSQNRGKMIFISSAAAYIGSRDIPYSISKAAILGLVRGLSKNLKGVNVYIYGIAPGIVETDMSNQMSTKRKDDAINGTINNRICSPIEVAKAVRFLLFEDDGYMNGSVLHINNGLYLN